MEKLKPCPFCGGKVELKKYTSPHFYTDHNGKTFWRDEPDGWAIECNNHEWRVGDNDVAGDVALYSGAFSDESKEQLIEAWNTRHEQTCSFSEKDEYGNRHCSSCGFTSNYIPIGVRYCPRCGAKVV